MTIPVEWLNDETIYSVNDIDMLYNRIRTQCRYVGDKNKTLNVPISLDLETSSFYDTDGNKTAIMYIWMIGLFGFVIVGRTWDEYMQAYRRLCYIFRTCGNSRKMIWYVHNLSFDFQFIRKHHEFINVFSTGRYAPLYALTVDGVEFRCSYRLSGFSLEKLAKNLQHHKIRKMVGDLDYQMVRHSNTPLTDAELKYCTHDVKVVCAYIAECITDEGEAINTIPLTNTGYVRRDCRNACFAQYGYHDMIHDLSLTALEFQLCRDAFMGGYVHSNPVRTNIILKMITSLDISSSYPTVMVAELFPMSAPVHVKIRTWSEFKYYLGKYCCIFSVTIKDIKSRYDFDYYIPASKCKIYGTRTISNGRVVSADEISLTITELDFDVIEYMYDIYPTNVQINEFMYFEKGYLPTPFVKQILSYYEKKTTLADLKEYIAEYNRAKRMQNSCYGMTATNPLKDEVKYIDNEWSEPIPPDMEQAIEKYNNSWTRFLYYPWAVYVTAYARHNVWEAIIECGDDYVYTDTDSVKTLNFSAHAEFFRRYNERIQDKLRLACKVHGIDKNSIAPKNADGEIKPLGIFKNEGTYSRFKTNGAKRYMYTTMDNVGAETDIKMVCAGVNPKSAIKYLRKICHDDYTAIFKAFDNHLCIPAEYSGRLIHTYVDSERKGTVTDYNGDVATYEELSAVHLEPSDYNLSIAGEFMRFILKRRGGAFSI